MFRSDLVNAAPPSDIHVPIKKNMMCLNESVLDPYQAISDAFHQVMQDVHLNRYFSNTTPELETMLSDYIAHGVNQNQILWGNGADEMLFTVFLAVRENNDAYALSLAPSYFDYSTYSRSVGLGIKFQDYKSDFSFDKDEYIANLKDENCRLGILCNPNNPTGHMMDDETILEIIESTNKPILLDETYFEFSGKTFVDRIKDYKNLMIVRSFSKAFSGSGLRFGYLISQEQNIVELKKAMTIFHSSILIQAFVISMLQNKDIFLNHTKNVVKMKHELYQKMSKIESLKVYPSHTNFLTFSIGEKSGELFEFLKDNEIAIRDIGGHKILKNHLRVSIGSKEQNEYFLEKLNEFLKEN